MFIRFSFLLLIDIKPIILDWNMHIQRHRTLADRDSEFNEQASIMVWFAWATWFYQFHGVVCLSDLVCQKTVPSQTQSPHTKYMTKTKMWLSNAFNLSPHLRRRWPGQKCRYAVVLTFEIRLQTLDGWMAACPSNFPACKLRGCPVMNQVYNGYNDIFLLFRLFPTFRV